MCREGRGSTWAKRRDWGYPGLQEETRVTGSPAHTHPSVTRRHFETCPSREAPHRTGTDIDALSPDPEAHRQPQDLLPPRRRARQDHPEASQARGERGQLHDFARVPQPVDATEPGADTSGFRHRPCHFRSRTSGQIGGGAPPTPPLPHACAHDRSQNGAGDTNRKFCLPHLVSLKPDPNLAMTSPRSMGRRRLQWGSGDQEFMGDADKMAC